MNKLTKFKTRYGGTHLPSGSKNELCYPFGKRIPKLAIENAKILCEEIGLNFREQPCPINIGNIDLIIYE